MLDYTSERWRSIDHQQHVSNRRRDHAQLHLALFAPATRLACGTHLLRDHTVLHERLAHVLASCNTEVDVQLHDLLMRDLPHAEAASSEDGVQGLHRGGISADLNKVCRGTTHIATASSDFNPSLQLVREPQLSCDRTKQSTKATKTASYPLPCGGHSPALRISYSWW